MGDKINAIFHKAYKWQLAKKVYKITEIAEMMQMKLFNKSTLPHHC